MDRLHTRALIGLLLLTTWLYSSVVSAPFVFEDAKALQQIPGWSLPGRGLTQWTWMAIGYDSPTAHAVNIGLHLVNGTLVAVLGSALAGPTAGVVAAGVLLLHPLSSEAVSYVTGRADLLVTLFVLLGVWLTVRWSQDGGAWRLACVGASLVLAAMSKEIGLIGIPLTVWTLIVVRRLPHTVWLLHGLWLGLGLVVGGAWDRIAGWIGMSGHNGGSVFAWPEFAALQLVAVWRVLLLTLWPVGFTIDPDIIGLAPTWHVWTGLLTLLTGALVVWAWRRAPLLAWGLGWVGICVAPRFVFATNEFMKEYQSLTAFAGLSVLLGVALAGQRVSAPQWRERIASA